MQILKDSFADRDPVKVGVVGVIVLVVLTLLLFNAVAIYNAVTRTSYTAQFSEAGGLQVGDPVRLNGAEVGKVKEVRLDGELVAVGFSIENVGRLGEATRASISAETVLGTKYLEITPDGPGRLESGGVIPLERTNSPYDITEALSTLTRKSAELDKDRLAGALNTISESLKDTPAPLRSALDGVSRVSQTIASRDTALRELLAHAQSVTDLLARRTGDIVTLVGEGRQLLAELNTRREVIRKLIVNVTETIDQLDGVVKDNDDQLGPALRELEDTLDLLNRNDKAIGTVVHGLNVYAGSLGDAVGSGPWFYAYVANLSALPGALGNLPIANRLPVPNLRSGLPGVPGLSTLPGLPAPGGGR